MNRHHGTHFSIDDKCQLTSDVGGAFGVESFRTRSSHGKDDERPLQPLPFLDGFDRSLVEELARYSNGWCVGGASVGDLIGAGGVVVGNPVALKMRRVWQRNAQGIGGSLGQIRVIGSRQLFVARLDWI